MTNSIRALVLIWNILNGISDEGGYGIKNMEYQNNIRYIKRGNLLISALLLLFRKEVLSDERIKSE